ncbi:alpha/beta hydrolase [Herbaspirillum sp. HC18]|nr:alpha/beta hydrolase [Herbaspirillum sp. HC18]
MTCISPIVRVPASDTIHTLMEADVVLPAGVITRTHLTTKWKYLPADEEKRIKPVPVVIFMHGSSGLSQATKDFQRWLADQGVASVAPDSFARAGRIKYKSPAPKDTYEAVHIQRSEELEATFAAVRAVPWANTEKIFLAGSSEGAVSVARYGNDHLAGRILFAWSCEDNYFVDGHRTVVKPDEPVLNVISLADPFFSPASPFSDGAQVTGHGGNAFSSNKSAEIVLVPGAPHTLYNLPQVRAVVKSFLALYAGIEEA